MEIGIPRMFYEAINILVKVITMQKNILKCFFGSTRSHIDENHELEIWKYEELFRCSFYSHSQYFIFSMLITNCIVVLLFFAHSRISALEETR
jgi:hypothetical protein